MSIKGVLSVGFHRRDGIKGCQLRGVVSRVFVEGWCRRVSTKDLLSVGFHRRDGIKGCPLRGCCQ